MFKLDPNPTFTAKVQLSIPGQAKPVDVEVEFKHFDTEALKTYYAALPDKNNVDGLAEVIVSWKDFDASYSRDALEKLLKNYPTSAGELYAAFRREHLESKVKN